ncbi:hypothetical protein TNCV_1449571 [Trichonephila clavipes]|nr:hypothetical protein TNCV_1449571 [Trichonephila clavipes]
MQKTPAFTLPELEAVYDKWILSFDVFEKCVATAICASVWRRYFLTFRHQHNIFRVPRSRRSPNEFIVFDGFSALYKTPMPFVNLGSRHGRFTIHLT